MLLVVLVLLVVGLPTAKGHFGVIGVNTSRRRTPAPRLNGRFGSRAHLYASTTAITAADSFSAGDEDGEEVPEDYEDSVKIVPTQERTKTVSFQNLGLAGKLVRGTKNIILVTTTNLVLGIAFGGVTGGVRGFPNLMTRKEGLLGTPWKEEYGMRWTRYSGKCYRWASLWGPVFAVWGFTDTLLTVLRNGTNDEFNFMCASSAAAIWHNRDKSIQRKVIVGVGYAALTLGYVKFNEYYVVGPAGWQDKYNRNDDDIVTDDAAATAADGSSSD